jgi:hypothetical protein
LCVIQPPIKRLNKDSIENTEAEIIQIVFLPNKKGESSVIMLFQQFMQTAQRLNLSVCIVMLYRWKAKDGRIYSIRDVVRYGNTLKNKSV